MADYGALVQACPVALKNIKPYLQRAQEFQPKHPLVSYYLATYAAQLGVETAPTEQGFLIHVMDALEAKKKSLNVQGVDGKEVLAGMYGMLFKTAEDRVAQSQADLTTIKLYFTASTVMEALLQFGETMDPEVYQMYRYARYTAGQIKKAIDQGIPYVHEGQAQNQQDDTPPALPTPIMTPPAPPPPQQPAAVPPVPAGGAKPWMPPPSATMSKPITAGGLDKLIEAQKYTKFALSALQFNDAEGARTNLMKALQVLDH